jgi:Type VI secretion system/phage-baseplate injector OB domain
MASRIPGIHRAQVIDTKDFGDTGTIQVRVLGINPEGWEDCELMTPFGGLPNMGMIAIPPIGAIGYVFFEREDSRYGVWVGSVVPSVKTFGDNIMKTDSDTPGIPVETQESDATQSPTDFIIKTQYTAAYKAGGEELTSTDNKVENIIKMNENELTLAKVAQSDKYAYQAKSYKWTDVPYNTLSLTDKSISINFKFADNSSSNTMVVTQDQVAMNFDTQTGKMTSTITKDTITLSAGGTTIVVKQDGNVEVTTSAKIQLNGSSNTAAMYEGLRDFINNAYNSHTHGTPAGPSSPPVSPYTGIQSAKSKSVVLT